MPREKVAPTTYRHDQIAPERSQRRAEVLIGNERDPDVFSPQMLYAVWNRECWLRVHSPVLEGSSKVVDDSDSVKIRHIGAEYETEFSEARQGVYDMDIILYQSRPGLSRINLPIQHRGIRWHPQPQMTQAEFDAGDFQQEKAAFSLALYHADRKWGNEYVTGKVAHIWRPELIDALGDRAWGRISINPAQTLLRMDLPTAWLRDATYPVRIDPSIGNTSIGGSSATVNAGFRGSHFTMPSNQTIDTMGAFFRLTNAAKNGQMAIYDDTAGAATNLDHNTSSQSVANADPTEEIWTGLSFAVVAEELWLCADLEGGAGAENLYFDTVSAGDGTSEANTFGTWPDPATSTNDSRSCSVYASWTAAGGATPKGPLGHPLHGPLAGPIGP